MSDADEKLSPYPFTPETLPPHQARVLTAEQRLALPDFEIQHGHPGKGFITLQTPDEGRFTLFPERMNGDDPMTEVRYYVPRSNVSQVDRSQMTPLEAEMRFGAISGYEVGCVWSQEKAIELFDYARRHAFEASLEEQLLAAGFEPQATEGLFRKDIGRDSFSVALKPECVALMFEPRNQPYWHNLFVLHTHRPWYDETAVSPVLWPDTFSDPKRTLTGMAVRMTEIWSPDLLPKAKKGRKPKA